MCGFFGAWLVFASVNACQADQLNLNFASVPGASVDFNGTNSTFTFVSSGGAGFNITLSNMSGDSVGDTGTISGTFTIGAITTVGGVQTATVTGSGMLDISDGTHDLTATLQWVNVQTQDTAGNFNTSGTVNLSSVTYTGSSQDLLALANGSNPAAIASFSLNPGQSLTQLTTSGKDITTGYSGVFSAAVPEPGATMLTLTGLPITALALSLRRRKATRPPRRCEI
jgi:hypothetical protein